MRFGLCLLSSQCLDKTVENSYSFHPLSNPKFYVHTSHIKGGCKRVLIYFKVDPLRPSSQFPVDYTGFKADRNKDWAKFQENFEVR